MTLVLDESQRAALRLVVASRLGIVTGGPGTGKTTSLRAALDELDGLPEPDEGTRYELAAPTGKAARRMMEATGRPARTIHRLLEWGREGAEGFARDAKNPLETGAVIVDEASMLDVELAAALVDAIDQTRTRLVLVGDVHQLPPVGPGCPFRDLIASKRIPVARLTTLHRAAAESWVCTQAPAVLAGRVPALAPRPDFAFARAPSAGHVPAAVLEHVRRIARSDEPLEVQVLSPQHNGAAGTTELNRALQAELNPEARAGAMHWGREEHLYLGDRVIQTRNDYDLDVMNGEIGAVVGLSNAELSVQFDDERVVQFSREKAKGLHLAYALTTHKSQGSEWPWVVVVVHSTHTQMLTRSLLYTAITRARRGVVIVGDEFGLERAVKNAHSDARNSSLVTRLGAPA